MTTLRSLDDTTSFATPEVIRELRMPDRSLVGLAIVLRDRSLWPEDFSWDYNKQETCALGLAHRIGWIDKISARELGKALGVNLFTVLQFHSCAGGFGRMVVTPEIVATTIDEIVARRGSLRSYFGE